MSDLVIGPIQGLDSKIIVEVANKVVAAALAPLKAESRPDFLTTSPPAVYAAAHANTWSASKPVAVA